MFPLFVMEILGLFSGLPGLFVAGIFSGALSTVSSGLNSLAAVTLEDFVKPMTKDMSDRKATIISKLLGMVLPMTSKFYVDRLQKFHEILPWI